MAAIPRTSQSGEPGATTAPAPTLTTEHNPLSRYPGSGTVGTVDQQLAAIATGDGSTAVARSTYLGSVLAAQTGADPVAAVAQVEQYREQTGYYPDVGQSTYGLTSDQKARIYGSGGAGTQPGAGGGSTAGKVTEAGVLSGLSLNNPITLAILLGAGVLAFALFGKKGGRRVR